jgi:hypothetical protein
VNLKTLIRSGEPGRTVNRKTKYCSKDVNGKPCGERTREGKDFCGDHIDELPYVKKLLQRIQDKEDEVQKVRKKGKKAVAASSENLKEIKTHLEFNGSRTTKRLQREMQMTESTIEGFVDYLEDEKHVYRSTTSRGDDIINPRHAFE